MVGILHFDLAVFIIEKENNDKATFPPKKLGYYKRKVFLKYADYCNTQLFKVGPPGGPSTN